jgi:hypothetical protein
MEIRPQSRLWTMECCGVFIDEESALWMKPWNALESWNPLLTTESKRQNEILVFIGVGFGM